MSDNQGYCKSCEKLADEIEQLNNELKTLGSVVKTHWAKLAQRAGEIQRLQGNNERLLLDNLELRNEIERLRENRDYWKQSCENARCLKMSDGKTEWEEGYKEGYADCRAEMNCRIERLNSELLKEKLDNIGKVHPCDDSTAGNLASALANNKWLRENRDYWKQSCESAQENRDTASIFLTAAEAEIKRLCGERDNWKELYLETKENAEKLQKELDEARGITIRST